MCARILVSIDHKLILKRPLGGHMSHEKMKAPIFSDIPHLLSDDKVSLIILAQGKYAIKLDLLNQEDTAYRCFQIGRAKRREKEGLPPFREPSTYFIQPENNRILITGNLDELIDATEILCQSIQYISTQKQDELIREFNKIYKKEMQEQKRKNDIAKGQAKNPGKYLRLAEQYGLDPNLIFANPEAALKKPPSTTPANDKKSHKKK